MTAIEVAAASVIAGVSMALVNEIGYRAGMMRANLLIVDGEFALRRIGMRPGRAMVYAVGAAFHVITGAAFGAVYYGLTRLLDIEPSKAWLLAPYVLLLWLAMLLAALPVAGQGLLGRRASRWTWLEQLVLHAVFGVVFWAALQLF